MRTLLVLFPGAEKYRQTIETLVSGRLTPVFAQRNLPENKKQKLLSEAEVIFGCPDPMDLPLAVNLKWLQISWAGAAPFVEALKAQKIQRAENAAFRQTSEDSALPVLTNASGAYGVTIAEHALGMILALSRRLPAYERNRARGLWQDEGTDLVLSGKTALLLGTGDIGKRVAERLRAFGMTIIGYSRSQREAAWPFDEQISSQNGTFYALDDTLPKADVVFSALPDTQETQGLFSERRLSLMKKTSILVNVGRGSLIDTKALVSLLQQGHFFGVGLDVTDPEPLPKDHALWGFDRVIITPHVAGVDFGHDSSVSSAIWEIALSNLAHYVKHEPLSHVVNVAAGY